MDFLQENLSKIKVPTAFDNVYKDECMYSFDNPESSGGLYISLSTFLCFGSDFVEKYSEAKGDNVFLHLKRQVIQSDQENLSTFDSQPEPKITKLAIGIEGGFQSKQKKYKDIYNVVVFPKKVKLAYPSSDLPLIVQQSIEAILKCESASEKLEKNQLTGTWNGELRKHSKFASDLKQLNVGKKIPPSGWKCQSCDLTENLWLNLTDGSIFCGRKNFDGSGGNNHAVEHFQQTGYPLAVKLGTISSDNKADVFSYIEDEMVLDPKLSEHLKHFGINIQVMEKSEKSMIELELDMNKRIGEWSTMTESDSKLIPVSGPGLTGMMNMGNYCYMNSVMQVIFTIPDFINIYVEKAMSCFLEFPRDPANDFNIQMCKLGTGLWSGRYSHVPTNYLENSSGICPRMFKHMIGKNHPDFSTHHQQDALDFYLHLVAMIQKHCRKTSRNNNINNPMNALKFCIEDRVKCTTSGKVKYSKREEYCLSLSLPMEKALNINDLDQDREMKKTAYNDTPRIRISFQDIIDNFARTEKIDQYYSSAISGITTAEKYSRFVTMPDFLLVQFKKFTLRNDWVPVKLDVAIENLEEIDLSRYRSLGRQPNEELLPDCNAALPEINKDIIDSLTAMGFPAEACKKAVFHTNNSSIEEAADWIMQHITDSDINDPFVLPGFNENHNENFIPDSDSLTILMNMGFDLNQATKALKETDNNIERATDWIFSHPEIVNDMECDDGACNESKQDDYRDGSAKYKLVAFISHMGSFSHAGHYVCHIFKEDKWVIFNDNKVAISKNPPKDLGYLYLYKRDV